MKLNKKFLTLLLSLTTTTSIYGKVAGGNNNNKPKTQNQAPSRTTRHTVKTSDPSLISIPTAIGIVPTHDSISQLEQPTTTKKNTNTVEISSPTPDISEIGNQPNQPEPQSECEKELEKYKECEFLTEEFKISNANISGRMLIDYCKLYESEKCQNYFKNLYTMIPHCKNDKNSYKIVDNKNQYYRRQKFLCQKLEEEDKLCPFGYFSNLITKTLNRNSTYHTLTELNCKYNECTMALQEYISDINFKEYTSNKGILLLVNNEYDYIFGEECANEDENGDWSYDFEKNEWCDIIPQNKNNDECLSLTLSYPYCSKCDSYVTTDDNIKWGVENNEWCGIKSNC
eukprot:jgi/Orpsp1_1/1181891/evm.model.c7180000079035.2